MAHSYLHFPEIRQHQAVIVDSFHPNGLVLSHWRGAPTPAPLREDTSAGIVLQALKQNWPDLKNYHYVTANHFDIDALVGVWAILNPEKALRHEEVLRQMAVISDFRELDLALPEADLSLKLVCWVNAEEKSRFYRPFGAGELEESEATASVPKFLYFLDAFASVLDNPEAYRPVWEEEYNRVLAGYAQLHGPETEIETYPEVGLVVIKTPAPVHYYALFSQTKGFDLVLTLYTGQRYELESKYTTWVDLASRTTLPRPNLKFLASKLNNLETSGLNWKAEGPTDTGPLLRLQKEVLTKAQRYAHPYERPVYPSSISPDELTEVVRQFLTNFYQDIVPKENWSWADIKRINERMQINGRKIS